MGLFDELFSSKGEEEAARNAAAAKKAGYDTGVTNAGNALDTGFTNASGYYDRALTPFTDLSSRGTAGYDKFFGTYGDATGVNGADGVARAKTAFTSLPGYTEGINMALDQNDRRANARGMLASGNTIADTTKLATDYNSQKYGDYLSALLPGLSSGQQVMTTGATGQGGILTSQAGMAGDIGKTKAGFGYQSAVGSGGAEADSILAQQQAKEKASSNFWGALMGGASLGLKAFGMPSFGGGNMVNGYNVASTGGVNPFPTPI